MSRCLVAHEGTWHRQADLGAVMTRGLLKLIVSVVVLLSVVFLPGAQPARAADQSIVDIQVSFQVINTNTSAVLCLSDGATYTVKGHISAPQGSLATGEADV